MTSWTTRLRDELREATEVRENAVQLLAEYASLSWDQWQALLQLRADAAPHQVTIRLTDAISADGYDLLDDDFDGLRGHCKLSCTKAPVENALRFVFSNHFANFCFQAPAEVERVTAVFVADLEVPYRAPYFELLPWTDTNVASPSSETPARPVSIVNDATGQAIVPTNLGPWLLIASSTLANEKLHAVTARRMALSLATSVYLDPSHKLVALADLKRKVKAEIEPEDDLTWKKFEAPCLSEAASWVYFEGSDTENRHSLLAAEISRSFSKGNGWGAGLMSVVPGALDSAKIAYRLHLYDKSIDALKLMSDLRKSLSDDVKSVATQTSTLAAGLWRDAAVGVGAVAFKYLSGPVGRFVLILTAMYLLASWYLNSRIALKAVAVIKASEVTFRQKLFLPLLTTEEYTDLAGSRYESVLDEFCIFVRLVTVAYIVAAMIVLSSAFSDPIVTLGENVTRWMMVRAASYMSC